MVAYIAIIFAFVVSDLCALLSSAGGRGSISATSISNLAEFVTDMCRGSDDTGCLHLLVDWIMLTMILLVPNSAWDNGNMAEAARELRKMVEHPK